jgi:hypothetical protein
MNRLGRAEMLDGRMERAAMGAALLAGAVLAAGCGQAGPGSVAGRPAKDKPAAAAADGARAEFKPPADGRLTCTQVEMYLEVRERADRIREAAATAAARPHADPSEGARRGSEAGPSDGVDGAAAELRAAQELRRNPAEYLWVKSRVVEAQNAEATRALVRRMALGREQLIGRLRAERDRLADPAERAAAETRLAALARGLAEAEPAVPREVEANMRLLAGYRSRLARLLDLEERALVRTAAVAAGGEGGTEAGAAVVVAGEAAGAAGRSGAQEP